MVNSKDMFKKVLADVEEFKALGQKWCDTNDTVACAKSRSYSKRIIKSLRAYVELSIEEASKMEVTEVPQVISVEVKNAEEISIEE